MATLKSIILLCLISIATAATAVPDAAAAITRFDPFSPRDEMGAADFNSDGKVNLDELKAAAFTYDIDLTRDELSEIFTKADGNGDGYIDAEEAVLASIAIAPGYARKCAITLFDINLPRM